MKPTWLLLDTNNVLGLHGRGIGEGGSFVLPRPIVWIVATCEQYSIYPSDEEAVVVISKATSATFASQLTKLCQSRYQV